MICNQCWCRQWIIRSKYPCIWEGSRWRFPSVTFIIEEGLECKLLPNVIGKVFTAKIIGLNRSSQEGSIEGYSVPDAVPSNGQFQGLKLACAGTVSS